ncbi:hypothetical protein KFL_006390050 [Klebsormidium nitens]|uniref:Uncharacterized protein n=1 Tax=Klebsormidium nitens TaxID=105231 RepID=A0A1Y1IHT4_KLENI|nr:hypothetical protein KFL_006390050 [Klebsormidium nitens]|eukprot:GAQ90440.1 hypothetical protein KFL_006390050 [Klebsormidium nitens]
MPSNHRTSITLDDQPSIGSCQCAWQIPSSTFLLRGVFAFIREALADDLKLHFSEEARSQYWENQREDIVSALWGFPGLTRDLYGHQSAWYTAGFHRAHTETDRERFPALFLESPQEPVGEEQEPPVPSGWEDRSTGWGSG